MQEKNCSTTVVEAFRRHCIPSPLKPQRIKFAIYFCKINPISKPHLSAYLPSNLSNKNPKSCYTHTMQGTTHSMSWHMKALPLKVMGPKLAASIMPTLYMGNLVMRWKGGSTRGYPKTYRRHLTGPWTLNPGSSPSSAYIPGKSTTLTSAETIKSSRSLRLIINIIKVRIVIQITKSTKITTIAIPTALTTTRTVPTMATTPPMDTSGTTTRVTTQRYNQT